MGCYGLPNADRYALAQLRRDLGVQLGVDPDRDWKAGVLKKIRADDVEHLQLFERPWYTSVWVGRVLSGLVALGAIAALLAMLS
jgi:type VI secretion system protein ImpK